MNQISPIKLSDLAYHIQEVIHESFHQQSFWVVADVTNHTFYAKKLHHYFDLVEKHTQGNGIVARMNAVAWTEGHYKIDSFQQETAQLFKNDLNVLVKIQVDYHPAYGLKLVLKDIDTNFTLGLLEQQRQYVLLRLANECSDYISLVDGKFITLNNSLQMPAVIQKVAVISSAHSAGYEDFVHSIESNPYGYKFHLENFFAGMQGQGSAQEICNRLTDIENSGKKFDAVIIIRGGGAQTDFINFDTFLLGEIVARFPIPIITGIGHQKNQTIIDMMAHTSAKTPTKVAELIIAHNRHFVGELFEIQFAISNYVQNIISRSKLRQVQIQQTLVHTITQTTYHHREVLARSKENIVMTARTAAHEALMHLYRIGAKVAYKQKLLLVRRSTELKTVRKLFTAASTNQIKYAQKDLAYCTAVIKVIAPNNVLAKGYAQIINLTAHHASGTDVGEGQLLEVHTQNQKISATVVSIRPNDRKYN